MVKNNQDNNFNSFDLTNINSITLNTQVVIDNHVNTKSYVDQLKKENEQSRRDPGIDFYNESSDLEENNQGNIFTDNKLTYLDRIPFNRTPGSDNELANKNYIDDKKCCSQN